MGHRVQVRRVYDPPAPDDGQRILVDRLWPRGVSKARAALTDWPKEVAPSTTLRQWYGHDPDKFEEFARRYRQELGDAEHAAAFAELRSRTKAGPVTLLTGAKAVEISDAAVLRDALSGHSD